MRNLFFLLIAAGVFLNWGKIRDELSPPPDFSSQHPEGVVLYATEWCGYCRKTREFFKQHKIAFVEYDIEKSAEGRAQYNQLNGSGIPLVVIRGEVIRGYDPGSFKNALDL